MINPTRCNHIDEDTAAAAADDRDRDDAHAQWYDVPEFEFVPPGVVYEFPCEFVPEYELPFVMASCRFVSEIPRAVCRSTFRPIGTVAHGRPRIAVERDVADDASRAFATDDARDARDGGRGAARVSAHPKR
jgi:hypothetical protein